jgi:hypothetical protein
VAIVEAKQDLRRGVHTSVQALENDIREWIATWNDNPRPFTWTKTADEILNSLADYLAKLSTIHALKSKANQWNFRRSTLVPRPVTPFGKAQSGAPSRRSARPLAG